METDMNSQAQVTNSHRPYKRQAKSIIIHRPMQKARSHPAEARLLPLVSAWFQDLLTPLLGVLFTFPSQ